MSRVIKKIEYNTRAINFSGTVVFAAMGKYVTDFLTMFHRPGFVITAVTQADQAQLDADQDLTARMAEALDDIARYVLPVFTVQYEGRDMQMVPLENADYLRTMAKEARSADHD